MALAPAGKLGIDKSSNDKCSLKRCASRTHRVDSSGSAKRPSALNCPALTPASILFTVAGYKRPGTPSKAINADEVAFTFRRFFSLKSAIISTLFEMTASRGWPTVAKLPTSNCRFVTTPAWSACTSV